MKPQEEILALAARQFGIVERRHLLMFGLTHRMIRGRVNRKELVEIFPGSFRIGGTPQSWKGDLLAAQLSLGPTAVVSHRSCAALYELEGYPPGLLELTVIGDKRALLPGVVQHRSTTIKENDVRHLGAFVVTRPERLLIDLAAVVPSRLLETAFDSILFKRLSSVRRIAAYLRAVRRPGLNGAGRLARLLSERDPDQAPAASFFETDFYRFLRRSYGNGVQFQYEVRDGGKFVARLDAAFPEQRVGVEAHSLRWHSSRERVQRDADRHNRLSAAGWRVLYETYENLNRRPREILARLDKLLAREL